MASVGKNDLQRSFLSNLYGSTLARYRPFWKVKMIIHVSKKPDPYAMIPKKIINDDRLSYSALGIMVILLANPEPAPDPGRFDSEVSEIQQLVKFGYITIEGDIAGNA